MFKQFKNRQEAGELLALALQKKYTGNETVVYALPRGGVALGCEIAQRLKAPFDLIIVRKIGHPKNPEYALAVVSEMGELLHGEEGSARLNESWFRKAVETSRREAKRRRELYLQDRLRPSVEGKIAVIVDDGVATGLTLRLAVKEIKHLKPDYVVVAVPVVPADTAEILKEEADELIAIITDDNYRGAVGAYYDDFKQVEDREVVDLIQKLR